MLNQMVIADLEIRDKHKTNLYEKLFGDRLFEVRAELMIKSIGLHPQKK